MVKQNMRPELFVSFYSIFAGKRVQNVYKNKRDIGLIWDSLRFMISCPAKCRQDF